jgi:hypothetical protein
MTIRILASALVLLISTAHPAVAQNQTPREVLSFLLTTQRVATGDFIKDEQATNATRDTLSRALLVNLTNVPLTTSSGGFNYRFDPALGTMQRASEGFGPFFVDRASTAGQGQASLSVTYQRSRFSTMDGRSLRDGTLVTTSNKFRDESAPFDVETLALTLETRTVTVFGNYGIADGVDIGFAVPVVQLDLSGERLETYRGTGLLQARGQASAMGLADIPIRGKIQFPEWTPWKLATDLEVRLPTGDPEMLNGSGRYAFTGTFVASVGERAIESHVNAGFTVGGASNQILFGGAVAGTIASRLTLSAEALVRRIEDLKEIGEVAEPHPSIFGVNTIRLLPIGGALTTTAAVFGARWNVTRAWLISSHIFLPLTDKGLVAKPMPAFSVDYSFEL